MSMSRASEGRCTAANASSCFTGGRSPPAPGPFCGSGVLWQPIASAAQADATTTQHARRCIAAMTLPRSHCCAACPTRQEPRPARARHGAAPPEGVADGQARSACSWTRPRVLVGKFTVRRGLVAPRLTGHVTSSSRSTKSARQDPSPDQQLCHRHVRVSAGSRPLPRRRPAVHEAVDAESAAPRAVVTFRTAPGPSTAAAGGRAPSVLGGGGPGRHQATPAYASLTQHSPTCRTALNPQVRGSNPWRRTRRA